MGKVHQKLAKARSLFQSSGVKKGGKVSFGGRSYEYFELDDILPVVNKINEELGILSLFSLEQGEHGRVGRLKVMDVEDGEGIDFSVTSADVKIQGQAIQAVGAEITYIKRYCYQNAYEIAEPDTVNPLLAAESSGEVRQASKRSDQQKSRKAENNGKDEREENKLDSGANETPITESTLSKVLDLIEWFEEEGLESKVLKSLAGPKKWDEVSERQGEKLIKQLTTRMENKQAKAKEE